MLGQPVHPIINSSTAPKRARVCLIAPTDPETIGMKDPNPTRNGKSRRIVTPNRPTGRGMKLVKILGVFLVVECLCSVQLAKKISFLYQADTDVMNSSKETFVQNARYISTNSINRTLFSLLARDSVDGVRPSKRPELTDEFLDRFIVVPEYKLLFCYVEKVGCSMFNHLFRMLRLLHPSLSFEEAQFQAATTWFRNTPEHHHVTKSELEDMLMDPMWTKATFFRDPATRFLSAYRSKCVFEEDGTGHCRHAFGSPHPPSTMVSFDQALLELNENPDEVFENEHFSPAHLFCGGLGTTLDYYDFVHQLRKPTSPDHIQRLLSRLGVDSNVSEALIQNVVKTGGTALDRDQELLRERYPQEVTLRGHWTQEKEHNTGSNERNVLQDSYGGTQFGLQMIYKHYGLDYDLFQLPRLGLQELQEAAAQDERKAPLQDPSKPPPMPSTNNPDIYNRFYWKDLPYNIQKAAEILGYTEALWESHGSPAAYKKYWADLTEDEQAAAKEIGYIAETWDNT